MHAAPRARNLDLDVAHIIREKSPALRRSAPLPLPDLGRAVRALTTRHLEWNACAHAHALIPHVPSLEGC